MARTIWLRVRILVCWRLAVGLAYASSNANCSRSLGIPMIVRS